MIRVLVVDDSAVIRVLFEKQLSKYEDIEVVGSAIDPYVARDKIAALNPDVLILDIEMPRMDGLTFLEKLMKHHPLPVVICSSLTAEGSEIALQAFYLGAVDVVPKPGAGFLAPSMDRIVRSVRAAASVNIDTLLKVCQKRTEKTRMPFQLRTTHRILAIGASTGGPQAIESVLGSLSATAPGTVIVQHMPQHFTASFASRLNASCPMQVREARDKDLIVPGVALVAPGNQHMTVEKSGTQYLVKLSDGALVQYQRPSVDVLFQSVAKTAGRNAVGVLLTGMGADGAAGLLDIRRAGGYTIAQDEQSSVVYGMPREAVKLDAADEVTALYSIPESIVRAVADSRAPTPAAISS
jgi:two-component system chemotaxis response regulator CheB